MWYRAAFYEDEKTAANVVRFLHNMNAIEEVGISHLILNGKHTVIVVGDDAIGEESAVLIGEDDINEERVATAFARILEQTGTLVDVSPDVIASTYARHDHRSQNKRLDAYINQAHRQGMHFIDAYAHLAGWRDDARDTDELHDMTRHACAIADRYIFTMSAIQMHQTVMKNDPAFVTPAQATYIEFEKTIIAERGEAPQRSIAIKAILIFPTMYPMIDEVTGDIEEMHTWLINVIAPNTAHVMQMEYMPDHEQFNEYGPTTDYTCPYGACQEKRAPSPLDDLSHVIYRIPCQWCLEDAQIYACLLHTAIEMIQKKYAVTPDAPIFPEKEIVKIEHTHVQREKSGKKRHAIVEHKKSYHMVSYDVSEMTRRIAAEQTAGTDRASWLAMHDAADIVYEKRHIDIHERSYPTRRDGTKLDGTVIVDAQDRYVPMLRADVRKVKTIKKVTARRFAPVAAQK